MYEGYVTLVCLHFEMKFLENFCFLTGSDPLMTFDPQTVVNPKTPAGNNACVVMTLLCYVICKGSDFCEFLYNFFRL